MNLRRLHFSSKYALLVLAWSSGPSLPLRFGFLNVFWAHVQVCPWRQTLVGSSPKNVLGVAFVCYLIGCMHVCWKQTRLCLRHWPRKASIPCVAWCGTCGILRNAQPLGYIDMLMRGPPVAIAQCSSVTIPSSGHCKLRIHFGRAYIRNLMLRTNGRLKQATQRSLGCLLRNSVVVGLVGAFDAVAVTDTAESSRSSVWTSPRIAFSTASPTAVRILPCALRVAAWMSCSTQSSIRDIFQSAFDLLLYFINNHLLDLDRHWLVLMFWSRLRFHWLPFNSSTGGTLAITLNFIQHGFPSAFQSDFHLALDSTSLKGNTCCCFYDRRSLSRSKWKDASARFEHVGHFI